VTSTEASVTDRGESRGGPAWDHTWPATFRRILRDPTAVAALGVLVAIVTVAVLADAIAPYAPRQQLYFTEGSAVCNHYAPTRDHWFGVDPLCRDTFSRVVYGARLSLAVGLATQAVVLVLGVLVGSAAALGPRWLDGLLMRLTDAVYAFPDLLLVILLAAIFRETSLGTAGGGIFAIVLALSMTRWTTMCRLVRAQIGSLGGSEHVLAARALGASEPAVLFRHLLPNMLGPMLVTCAFGVPAAIFAEAALSYIGIGIRPPTASWGVLVNDGYSVILVSYWPVLIPAAAIAITTLAFTTLADGLRDALDPRSRGR
jgi:oligopeptide transport system permease protein